MSKKRSSKKPNSLKKELGSKILNIFKSSNTKTFNYKQIASELDITDSNTRKLIYTILNDLTNQGDLKEDSRGKFTYNIQSMILTGVVDAIKSGACYVVTDEIEEDVYVNPKNMGQAMHGDTVKVSLFLNGKRRKPEGEIVEVLEQKNREIVGSIEMSDKYAFLIPDNAKITVDIYIALNKLNGAKQGEKAIAVITDWPKGATSPFGEIIEVLGEPGEHKTEMNAIMAEFGLPREFPEEVEADAAKISLELDKEEVARRRDFRKITTFTIDPVDAKDFDDALSIQQLENGNWEIGVHIADVAHYVTPDSLVDREAIERATSVYLVDRVIPMLPEVLSNKVCSLRPEEEKFTFSAVFELNDDAEVLNEWFGRTVIYSDRRFSYEEAQERLETGEGDFVDELKKLDTLAKTLRAARMRTGSIEFSSREVKFELDEDGNPLRVFEKLTKDSNKLIEDFMLLANRRVAAFVGQTKQGQVQKPFIYRVHDDPDNEKLQTLSKFVSQFDYKVKFNGNQTSEKLNALLNHFTGTNEKGMIEQVAIRCMSKAIYTTENVGHYGLGFEYYSHFTSPIRRYPDLEVHRLLQHYLDGGKPVNQDALELVCKHSSIQEKQAADAERSSIKYMQVKFMLDKIGEQFEGMVTGLTEWGMYVEIIENKCEGMISLRDIGDDFYTFDSEKYRVVGQNSERVFYLGDKINIVVSSADLRKKQLNFDLVEE
jgi:ribonuclease R